MSHCTTYFPHVITVKGRRRAWVPQRSHFIGNVPLAAAKARQLRQELPRSTVRRFGCCVNVYV